MRLKIFGMLASAAVLLLSNSMRTTCQPSVRGQSQQTWDPWMRSSSVDDPRLTHIAYYLFIVLFAINCTNQIKSNYLNAHGEEAQEKPPGL